MTEVVDLGNKVGLNLIATVVGEVEVETEDVA